MVTWISWILGHWFKNTTSKSKYSHHIQHPQNPKIVQQAHNNAKVMLTVLFESQGIHQEHSPGHPRGITRTHPKVKTLQKQLPGVFIMCIAKCQLSGQLNDKQKNFNLIQSFWLNVETVVFWATHYLNIRIL